MLYEISMPVMADQADPLTEILVANGYYNVVYTAAISTFQDNNGYGFETRSDAPGSLKVYIEAELVDLVRDEATQIAQLLGLSPEKLRWQEAVQEGFQLPFETIDLNNGWKICQPDENVQAEDGIIVFDPQMAFGTGLHETTQDCLRLILAADLNGKNVLDLGAGSGLLSIAAGRKGAISIVAVDILPVHDEIMYNASLNGLSNIKVIQADILSGNDPWVGSYDWVFINIGAEETLQCCHRLKDSMTPGGTVLVSGLVSWNFEKTILGLEACGLKLRQTIKNNEWITLLFTKEA